MSTSFRDLLAWQEAMNLAVLTYRITSNFPKEETYGLTAQARKAAISIPSNIAEGNARNSLREHYYLFGVAAGSLAELETQLELAARLEYFSVDPAMTRQLQKVGMLLHALRRSRRA
ncbi:MAG TPA: four helix bundle protein [Burkholderiales bacterium]|nr:four helix bundle protein [Burkholderiales bacterium]